MDISIDKLLKIKQQNRQKSLAILIDPDKMSLDRMQILLENTTHFLPDFWLIGGSLLLENQLVEIVKLLKIKTQIPVLLFPGNYLQITSQADGILFLSLLSGRNPEFLIGQHVMVAPTLRRMQTEGNLEILPTAYILVDCGNRTSVQYISNTQPIPYSKNDLAVSTAIAGEMLGFKWIYLEGGSGAKQPISEAMIREVRQNTNLPLWIGGGIKTVSQLQRTFEAGADVAVLGTVLEENPLKWQDFYQTAQTVNQKIKSKPHV